MKILFVGDSISAQYVSAFYNEVKKHDDIVAELFDYGRLRKHTLLPRLELHYKNGMLIWELNIKLIKQVYEKRYDLVFVYYSTIIYASTIEKINKFGCKVFMYCNDNPFSEGYKAYIWRHFRKQIPYYDIIYAYRNSNISEYHKFGAREVKLLRSYYMNERNYYIPDDEIVIDVPEVVYIGHKENDDREEYIKAILDADIKVGLNYVWRDFDYKKEQIRIFQKDVATLKYNEILNKAKIAIVFLSKLNGDTYTRRCFEIPAAKTLMVAPYTEELSKMYEEDKEAVYFRSPSELVAKVEYYISHPAEREAIAEAGYQRLLKSGNEVSDRVNQIIEDYRRISG